MRHFIAILLLAVLAACSQPEDAQVKIVVGATLLEPGKGPVLDHAIVIVDNGVIQAVGPQASVPIPRGSLKINGLGKVIYPLDPARPVRPGDEANFGLYDADPTRTGSSPVGRMVGARWEVQR